MSLKKEYIAATAYAIVEKHAPLVQQIAVAVLLKVVTAAAAVAAEEEAQVEALALYAQNPGNVLLGAAVNQQVTNIELDTVHANYI